MRLLKRLSDGGFSLTSDILENDISQYRYAVLSHTWGGENEEITYEDMLERSLDKAGYRKIEFCGEQAAKDDIQYFWVDSCCIKKTSDAELSSSINSMFRWYQRAAKCYVYLTDVSAKKRKRGDDGPQVWERAFRDSKWFTRGWTLQELLAPTSVEFFSSDGERLGDRESLKSQIHEITGISLSALEGKHLNEFSVLERMSWQVNRSTTLEEDKAYCLIGIFDISMSPRYGEGRERAFERLNSKIKKATTTTVNSEHSAIFRWLSSPDPSTSYERALKLRQVGTGLWFLQHESYSRWKAGESHFMWLYGIPGCGKSILSSTILEDLIGSANQDGSAVVYFYFDFNDPQKRRADLMMRSILAQLLRKCTKLPSAVAALFSSCDSGNREPPITACVDTLRQLITETSRVFLVLDALDECDNRVELLEVVRLISGWQARNLYILLTSRKERDIEDTIVQFVNSDNRIYLQGNHVDPDIRSYIIQRLSNDKSLEKWRKDEKVQEEIETVLMGKAKGMFRWAACQLDTLAKCRNQAQLWKSLSTLPPTLDETYERILCAIPEVDADYAFKILRWLAFAERPLLFEEIAEIVAFDPEREIPFDKNEVLVDPLEVLDICSSLVSTTTISAEGLNKGHSIQHENAGQAVILAHYSVKEYLTSQRCVKGQASQYAMDETVCQTLISESCLSALLFSFPNNNRESTGMSLGDYSGQFWTTHGKKGQKSARWTRRAVMLCSNSSLLTQWVQKYDPRERWDGNFEPVSEESLPQGLYCISKSGFTEVALQLIETCNADVNAPGGAYGNALEAAALRGHGALVELLLSTGADISAQGGEYGNALQAAAFGGHEAVVELLLSKGADINAQGGAYGNALQAAAYGGHEAVVELLLSKGADINAQGGEYGNALQAAASGGHEAVVELLLSKGADINAQGGEYGNALQAAACGGHKALVGLLLSKGADLNSQGGFFDNALSAAAYGGYKKLVEMLLNLGVDINAQGKYRGNALKAAKDRGHDDIVKLLISRGADVNAIGRTT